MARETTSFRHKQNKDGSYDSICPTCCITVARSRDESNLAAHEQAHICYSAFLAERGLFTPAKPIHRPAA
jgi:hypothetical protein